MRRILISIACAGVAPFVFAQTTATPTPQSTTAQPATAKTTAKSTTGSGTVTRYERGRTIVVREGDNPVTYVLGKTVHYVNKAGRKIDEHIIQPGKRVIIHYTGTGERRTVHRVEVED